MEGFLIRFPDIKGVFTINDPQPIGSDLAIRQLHRKGIVITSVDGAPNIVAALKDTQSSIIASASQDPYTMGMLRRSGGRRPPRGPSAGAEDHSDDAEARHARQCRFLCRMDAALLDEDRA